MFSWRAPLLVHMSRCLRGAIAEVHDGTPVIEGVPAGREEDAEGGLELVREGGPQVLEGHEVPFNAREVSGNHVDDGRLALLKNIF